MLIPVLLANVSPGFATSEELEDLLRKHALVAFRRADGWAKVGCDDMRDPDGRRGSSWKDRKNKRRDKPLLQISSNSFQTDVVNCLA